MAMVEGDETAGPPFDIVIPGIAAITIGLETAMVKALRRWLQANELFTIVTAVVGALLLLSLLMVFGGYLIVAR
jgi:uncharacterized membrane protein YeaQ/YmgE (transglycosylase-associated protein family)